jgi:hypothetical protein
MSKSHSISVTFLNPGYLVDDLHYDYFSRNCGSPIKKYFLSYLCWTKNKGSFGCDFYINIVCDTILICSLKETNHNFKNFDQ